MRLFVAVWPDSSALDALCALPRPDVPGVRWTTPAQWHVTLRFFGPAHPGEAAASLAPALPALTPVAEMGPASSLLGRAVLQVPVRGLEELAGAVSSATASVGRPERAGPFHGHLTLARGHRPADLRALAGAPVAACWAVEEVTLVSSVTGRAGSRYEIVERWSLDSAGAPPP